MKCWHKGAGNRKCVSPEVSFPGSVLAIASKTGAMHVSGLFCFVCPEKRARGLGAAGGTSRGFAMDVLVSVGVARFPS
jgi:hypothetical protein